MKKLMFSVTGIVAVAAVAGCKTQTSDLMDSNGVALTTAGGAPIVIVEKPNNHPPAEVSNDASMKERVQVREKQAKQEVQISVEDGKVAADVVEKAEKDLVGKLESSAGDFESLSKIVRFVDGRPQITTEALERAAKKKLPEGARVALSAMLEEKIAKILKEKVYPELIMATLAKISPAVDKAVAEGKYAVARNVIWMASTRGIPEVDEAVREKAIEMLHRKVNPSNWNAVAPKLKAAYDEAIAKKTYDAGIAKIKAVEAESLQQEYASMLDKRIAAIKAELKALGVPEKDMEPILAKQGALISAAAKILDEKDCLAVIEEARSEEREVSPRQDPALKAYYEKLDDFRETLVRFNCEKGSADQITIGLDDDLLALVNLLRKPAKVEKCETAAKTELELGTHSLNKRIQTASADYIAKLEDAKAKALLAAFKAKLEAAKSDLEKKVKALVADGKFGEARELIWNASITGDADWDAAMFALGIDLLRSVVNPADWNRIEREINGTYADLSKEGKFDELEKYLAEYPLIRQHTVKLDEQLSRVRMEAEALGAKPEEAAKAALVACGMVTEAQALVDHVDQIVADAAVAGKPVDESKLQAELDAYAKKLAAYHATPENVTKIVEGLKVELKKLIVQPQDPDRKHLELGTNAVNDRIKALKAKRLAEIAAAKRAWENERQAKLVTDLEARVRAAVREKKFTEARNMIRDEKLVGREDLDIQLYALRVGLLDSCVNPAQLDYLLAGIDAKVKVFVEKEDFKGLAAYVSEYQYVHDEYAKIDEALANVKKAMLSLEIPGEECEADEQTRFAGSIRELLEKRNESWKPERDLKPLEAALKEVAEAIFDHMNKDPVAIESERVAEYEHILSDIAALDRTLTTWEMNERLRAHLAKTEPIIAAGLAKQAEEAARQAYLDELAKIDAEVSFDAQIAMAEEAIARQLGQKCECASYRINAVLGEYARAFRLLKKKATLKPAEATSMLLGAAYLEQAAVIPYAIGLGADINGVSARDPRKRTALMLAIDAQNLSLVKTLVAAGASTTAVDAEQNAVLHYAVKSGNVTAVRSIALAATMNVVNAKGQTPLFEAVKRNQAVMAKTVLELVKDDGRGAFVNLADKSGLTAMALAVKIGSRDVLDPLAEAGAMFSEKELILAEEGDHVAIAQWLVAQGADVNAEGVMAKACPATATGRYLIHEGGIGTHACLACQPASKRPEEKPLPPKEKPVEQKGSASGTITFQVDGLEVK